MSFFTYVWDARLQAFGSEVLDPNTTGCVHHSSCLMVELLCFTGHAFNHSLVHSRVIPEQTVAMFFVTLKNDVSQQALQD